MENDRFLFQTYYFDGVTWMVVSEEIPFLLQPIYESPIPNCEFAQI